MTNFNYFPLTLKCQVDEGGGPNKMIVQGRKRQKEVVVKHKSKIYTRVCYFAFDIDRQ